MMKLLIAFGMLLIAQGAMAKDVVCKLPVEDATLTATFSKMKKAQPEVAVFVPSGETAGVTYKGVCKKLSGRETSIECNVMTSTDSGYTVTLASDGSPKLTATVTPWSMMGPGKAQSLPCN